MRDFHVTSSEGKVGWMTDERGTSRWRGNKSKNLKIFGGKWLVLIDIDVAVHLSMSVYTIHPLRCGVN